MTSIDGGPVVSYNVPAILEDMAAKGWNNTVLAKKSKLSKMAVGRFLRGERQTAYVGARITKALGQPEGHYVVRASEAVAP